MMSTDDERVAIISTSINPGEQTAYAAWAEQGDLIVAGDVSSHESLHGYVADVGGVFLTPDEQRQLSSKLSDVIGWRSIQRRNLALLYALENRYDYVVSVDDDNVPSPGLVAAHVAVIRDGVPGDTARVSSGTHWVNSADFVSPPTVQRGTPYARLAYGNYLYHSAVGVRPVVSQAHVLGDPDVGAATRFLDDPRVDSVDRNVIVQPFDDQWAAFNSQATIWDGRWAHFAAVPPGLGRYDDIFASFFLEAVLRSSVELGVHVGAPAVTQFRNEHDVRRDLRAELAGAELTLPLVHALGSLDEVTNPSYADVTAIVAHLLPSKTVEFMRCWSDELNRLSIEE